MDCRSRQGCRDGATRVLLGAGRWRDAARLFIERAGKAGKLVMTEYVLMGVVTILLFLMFIGDGTERSAK